MTVFDVSPLFVKIGEVFFLIYNFDIRQFIFIFAFSL